jgi:hypothetical protein
MFKVCKSVHHRTIQIITNQMQQFSSLFSWRLFTAQHVLGVLPPIIRSSMIAVAASGFTFISWWQSCCVRGRAGRPDYEHSTAITTIAVIELLMIGGRKPETCWAVNKRQDNKLKNFCIWLVIIWLLMLSLFNFPFAYSICCCYNHVTSSGLRSHLKF